MKADYSEHAGKTLHGLPPDVRKAVFKQVKFLEQNLRHPSLRAKKYDESQNLWQGRVNRDWRLYFLIRDDIYYIVDIIPHSETVKGLSPTWWSALGTSISRRPRPRHLMAMITPA